MEVYDNFQQNKLNKDIPMEQNKEVEINLNTLPKIDEVPIIAPATTKPTGAYVDTNPRIDEIPDSKEYGAIFPEPIGPYFDSGSEMLNKEVLLNLADKYNKREVGIDPTEELGLGDQPEQPEEVRFRIQK